LVRVRVRVGVGVGVRVRVRFRRVDWRKHGASDQGLHSHYAR